MEKYESTSTDKEDLTMLINFTGELYEQYHLLYNLELLGKKDTEEFDDVIKRIKEIEQITNNIESRLGSTHGRIISILRGIYKKINFNRNPLDFCSVSTYSNFKMHNIISRLINNFNQRKIAIFPNLTIEEYFMDENTDLSREQKETILSFIKIDSTYASYFLSDINKLVASIMASHISEHEPNSALSEGILRFKYDYGFILKIVEDDLLRNRYDADAHPFLIVDTVKKIYNIPDDKHLMIIRDNVLNVFKTNLPDFLRFSNQKLSNSESMVNILICQSLLRALIIAADEDTKKILVSEIEKTIADLRTKPNYSMICSLLEEVLTKIPEDALIPQIVTFGGR